MKNITAYILIAAMLSISTGCGHTKFIEYCNDQKDLRLIQKSDGKYEIQRYFRQTELTGWAEEHTGDFTKLHGICRHGRVDYI